MLLHSQKLSAGVLPTMFIVAVFLNVICESDVAAQELDPQQDSWVEYYSKHDNAPDPSKMLLNTDVEPDLSEGFVDLFNGKDLAGWKARGGTSTFEVEDGIIVGTCVKKSSSTYLCTEKSDYKDFVFTCEVKLKVDGNTGVQFRSQTKVGKKEGIENETVFGPQFEIEGQGKPGRNWTGAIYCQSCGGYFYPLWLKAHEAARAAEKKTDWNRITVSCKSDVVKTWINGVPASHWVDDGTYPQGFFGLQVHSGPQGTILFKNIRVKELEE